MWGRSYTLLLHIEAVKGMQPEEMGCKLYKLACTLALLQLLIAASTTQNHPESLALAFPQIATKAGQIAPPAAVDAGKLMSG